MFLSTCTCTEVSFECDYSTCTYTQVQSNLLNVLVVLKSTFKYFEVRNSVVPVLRTRTKIILVLAIFI